MSHGPRTSTVRKAFKRCLTGTTSSWITFPLATFVSGPCFLSLRLGKLIGFLSSIGFEKRLGRKSGGF
ncbi:hypothetical protein I312_106487 [Cryptococcus bacillisporus CA1280]|uniref:uncharacterized protein n=1 Tax=Cryptococcus bacillisporus CA1280 TaxID=1296109 RepID=UPI003368AF79